MDEWNTATRRFPVKTLPLTDKDTVPETPKYQTMAFDYPIAWGDEKDGSRIYALYPRFMAESDVPQPEDLYEACKTAQLFPYLRMSGVGRLYYSEQPLPAPSFETLVTYFGGMCGQLIDMDAAEYGDFSVRQMLQYLHDSEFPAFEWMEVSEEDTDAYTLFFGNWAISIHRVDEHHYDCVAMRHYWLDDFTMFYRWQDAMLIYPDGRMYY